MAEEEAAAIMRAAFWLPCLLALATTGCASQRQTGAAMVGVGAATAIVGASSASNSYCSTFGCYYRTPSPWGTKLTLAGAALAGAGYAVMAAAPRGDAQLRSPALPPTATGDAWRLRRKDPAPEPSPEPIAEESEP
jgi:hypothetical protein